MKSKDIMAEIILAMQPGRIARGGFLGNDPRPLAEILAADQAAVERLGLTHARIALRLRELRDAGQEGLGDPVSVPPRREAQVEAVRGQLPCPFGDKGLYPKTMISVRDIRDGTTLAYSDLSIHLIERHGFYGGRGSAFRLEPERIAAALGLISGRD